MSMSLEELYENFLRLEATLNLDPNPWKVVEDDA